MNRLPLARPSLAMPSPLWQSMLPGHGGRARGFTTLPLFRKEVTNDRVEPRSPSAPEASPPEGLQNPPLGACPCALGSVPGSWPPGVPAMSRPVAFALVYAGILTLVFLLNLVLR